MNPLDNPNHTIALGVGVTAFLVVVYVAGTGVGPTADWYGLVIRWLHFLAGITWIGLLYFFNVVNAGFMKSLDGPTKNIVIPKLMPTALAWFRHGASVTVLAGLLLYLHHYGQNMASTGAIAVGIGGLLGIIMWANVWFVIWPNQKKIIGAVSSTLQAGTPAPAGMAGWGRTALLASRINFLLSIPMLFFMAAGSHFTH
jgi:uncharacterized membrane protein